MLGLGLGSVSNPRIIEPSDYRYIIKQGRQKIEERKFLPFGPGEGSFRLVPALDFHTIIKGQEKMWTVFRR